VSDRSKSPQLMRGPLGVTGARMGYLAMSSLPQVLDTMTLEVRSGRRVPIRVERSDGTTLEGFLDEQTASGFSLLATETQSLVVVPFETVRRLWVPVVQGWRHWIYLAVCGLAGAGVGMLSVRLTGSPMLPGILLGLATALTVLLAGWLPPFRRWIVRWQLRYVAGDA
jgi:hypothetical protein